MVLDAAVLAGGLGTRLRPAIGTSLPKILAPVRGRPFLDFLLDSLERCGIRRCVLCLGHLADRVTAHMESRAPGSMEVVLSIEPVPLGTGGALAIARGHLAGDPVLVLNGDSWAGVDLKAFLRFHRSRSAFASMACVRVPDVGRYGAVEVDERGMATRFVEKMSGPSQPGLINAGFYLFSARALSELPAAADGRFSLERNFLQVLTPDRLSAFVCRDAGFVDIGTPGSLGEAGAIITRSRPAE